LVLSWCCSGYIVVHLPFLAIYLCSAYFLYLEYYIYIACGTYLTLVELDDHCEIMFKFLIEALQLIVDTFILLDHIQLHLLLSFMYSWRDCYLTHCGLAMMIHVISLGGSFLQLALCLLHLFLKQCVCEEFGDILVLQITTLS
jgi:hypothetical protein